MKNEKIPLRFTLHPTHKFFANKFTCSQLTIHYSLLTKKVFLVLQTYQHQDAYRQVRLPLYPVEYA